MLTIIMLQSHVDYRKSWTHHVEQQDPHSLATYLENHNNYVEQIHNINGMIDQYYGEGLPNLLQVFTGNNEGEHGYDDDDEQELDDVYHDVAGVVLESLTEGSKKITEKVVQ